MANRSLSLLLAKSHGRTAAHHQGKRSALADAQCEYEHLVNGSKQCGDGPLALSKGASPRLAGQSED